jgi:hypothetical protein
MPRPPHEPHDRDVQPAPQCFRQHARVIARPLPPPQPVHGHGHERVQVAAPALFADRRRQPLRQVVRVAFVALIFQAQHQRSQRRHVPPHAGDAGYVPEVLGPAAGTGVFVDRHVRHGPAAAQAIRKLVRPTDLPLAGIASEPRPGRQPPPARDAGLRQDRVEHAVPDFANGRRRHLPHPRHAMSRQDGPRLPPSLSGRGQGEDRTLHPPSTLRRAPTAHGSRAG